MSPVSPVDSKSAIVASGALRRTRSSTTRTRPGRSVTSIRRGEEKAMDQGTSRPVTIVSTRRRAPSFVRTTRGASEGVPSPPKRLERLQRQARRTAAGREKGRSFFTPSRLHALSPSEQHVLRHFCRQGIPGPAPVRDPILRLRGKLRKGQVRALGNEDRVPAESSGSPGRSRDRAGAFAPAG